MGYIFGFIWGILSGVLWSFSTVTPASFEQAVKKCENNGGLSKVIYNTIGNGDAYCTNGAKFVLKGEKE